MEPALSPGMATLCAFIAVRAAASVALLFTCGCSPATPLRIAVVGSNPSVAAARLAVADINAGGGVNGRELELVTVLEGESTDAQDAIASAERLTDDPRVLVVVGHSGSSRSLAASQVYNARGVPQVAPSSSTPLFTHAGPWSFRLVASDDHQARFIASHLARDPAARRVALIYANDDYGRAVHAEMTDQLAAAGRSLVMHAPFVEAASFTHRIDAMVAALAGTSPDLLIWAGRAHELALFRPRLEQALPNLTVLGTDAVGWYRSGDRAAQLDGDLMVSYVDTKTREPGFVGVAGRFESQTGERFTDIAALSYDAVGIVVAAMRSGATSREAIGAYLAGAAMRDVGYRGVTGRITFDANGDAPPRYILFVLRDDSLVRVAP